MIGAVMIIWTDIRVWSRLGINFEAGNPTRETTYFPVGRSVGLSSEASNEFWGLR